jgi:hypothetical protein
VKTAAAALAVAALALPPLAHGARIVGTPRSDLLHGTARADSIAARAGDDRIDVAGGGRDTVACGAGRDTVTADQTDRIAADCETVLRRISVDPGTGAKAEHLTEVEPSAFASGSTVVADFQVGRFADGGAVNIGFATSHDAGRTWKSGLLPAVTVASSPRGPWLRASDPVVTYDSAHGLWLASTLAIGLTDSAIVVARSADGLHWQAPVTVVHVVNGPQGVLLDKEWIACDNGAQSPFLGHCYVSYSDFTVGRMSTQTTADGGATWSAPAGSPDLAGHDGMQREAPAPQPLALPTGTLAIPIFEGDRMSAVTSPDGGATFTPETDFAPVGDTEAPFRAGPLPSGASDAAGNLFVAWSDGVAMRLSHSADGVTWSAPARVPLGAGRPFLPGLGARAGGGLALTSYVWSAAAKTLRAVLVTSADGGTTWSAPRVLSTDPLPLGWIARTTLGAMVGDYVATPIAGDRIVPVLVLAQKPLGGRLREAVYAASIPLP